VYLGPGADTGEGDLGWEWLHGGPGSDEITGCPGGDYLDGGTDDDYLHSGYTELEGQHADGKPGDDVGPGA
jgi:hypothetical protein